MKALLGCSGSFYNAFARVLEMLEEFMSFFALPFLVPFGLQLRL